MNFFKKINNNKGAGDLQLGMVCTLLIVVLALSMCVDFWNASVAKISVIKTIQSAEIYCLVKSIAGDYEKLRHNTLEEAVAIEYDLYADAAVTNMGDGGGSKTITPEGIKITKPNGELYEKLNANAYLKTYKVEYITKLPTTGQIGMRTKMTYTTSTLVRSLNQIMSGLRKANGQNKDLVLTANDEIAVTVASKLVPYTHEI